MLSIMEENQNDTPIHPEDPNRRADGTFAPGNNANPEGGHIRGWQPYAKRLQRFLEMPLDELEEILSSPQFKKYSAIDRAAAFQAKRIADRHESDHIAERERGNDRIEGKSRQPLAHGGDPDNASPIQWDGTFTLKFPDASGNPSA